jgi:hypothetical protein
MHRRVARFTLLSLLLAGMVAASFVLIAIERRSTWAVTAATQGLDAAARTYLGSELGEVTRQRWITLGVTATLLVGGLFALAPIARARPLEEPVGTLSLRTADPPAETAPATPQPPELRPNVDLASLARLCTDLSRVKSADALPDLLSRSSAALDASGLILWIVVGDRLLPVMAHGYPADTISRLSPVTRADDNAAAMAWRTGDRATVSGSHGSASAIVVPLLGIDACLGVLAFEVPHGREQDPVTLALGALLAAQLATVVPASRAEEPTAPSADALEPNEDSQAQSA